METKCSGRSWVARARMGRLGATLSSRVAWALIQCGAEASTAVESPSGATLPVLAPHADDAAGSARPNPASCATNDNSVGSPMIAQLVPAGARFAPAPGPSSSSDRGANVVARLPDDPARVVAGFMGRTASGFLRGEP